MTLIESLEGMLFVLQSVLTKTAQADTEKCEKLNHFDKLLTLQALKPMSPLPNPKLQVGLEKYSSSATCMYEIH